MDEEKQGVPPPQGEGPSQVHDQPPEPADDFHYAPAITATATGGPPVPPPPGPPPENPPEDQEEEGMLRMSFMEHLEELRSRIIKALYGLAVAFVASMVYCYKLWEIIEEPAVAALKNLHVDPPVLIQTTPMEGFSIIWVKLPL